MLLEYFLFLCFYLVYFLGYLKIMKITNKKTLEEIIRVDHAGERGAIKIYEGQLLALNTFKKDEKIQTEISNKFTISKFNKLAKSSGWQVKKHWKDKKRYYAVFLLQS